MTARADHFDIEAIAAWLCGKSGGDWAKPYTKRRVWMRRALALTVLADARLSKDAATAEAQKIMGGDRFEARMRADGVAA